MIRFVTTKGYGSSLVSVGPYKITRHARKHGRSAYRLHVLIDPDELRYRRLPGEHSSIKKASEAATQHAIDNGDEQARTLRSLVAELTSRVAALETERKGRR